MVSGATMRSGFIRQRLYRYPWRLLLLSLVMVALSALLLDPVFLVAMLLVCALVGWNLYRFDEHPDLQALARYGPPQEVVDVIDAELSDSQQVTRIGKGLRSFQMQVENDLGFDEIYLTPSWLVYFSGPDLDQFQVFHLDSLILVGRRDKQVVLIDRHGIEAKITGTYAGLTRLLAEILARVPWALSHFDEETERTWRDNRDQIITAVDRKRQGIQ